LLLYLSLI